MSALDWLIVAAYGAFLIVLGLYASRGAKTAESHLRGGRNLPAWAVVFSILSTEISAATYIGVPEKGFVDHWHYLQFGIGSLLGKLALATFVLALYWRLNLVSVYGFLGRRIGPRTQLTSAWGFLAGRLIASGVRLYIAALALEVAAGVPLFVSIALMAFLSTIYTYCGGLKAVVWTDVAQGSVFAIGALAALVFGLAAIDVPLAELWSEVAGAQKAQVVTFDDGGAGWLASNRPLPVAVLFGFFLVLASHGTDQENVQNLLNVRSARASRWSIVWSGLFTFPIVALFLSVGTMLWLYARHVGLAGLSASDSRYVFPEFIVHAMPAGLRGLVFAGLFAAAISGATLNATATIWTSDIRPLHASPEAELARVRRLIFVFGLLLCGVACFFAWRESSAPRQLIDTALSAMTILYGGILGAFAVALLLSRRGSDRSTVAGMLVGFALGAAGFFQKELFGWPSAKLDWAYTIPLAALATVAVAALGRRSAAAQDSERMG